MSRPRRNLGVLGGMGPAATALFMAEVAAHTLARVDQDHVNIIALSHATLPDRTRALRAGEDSDMASLLVQDAQELELAGAEVLAVPCNTAHAWLDVIQSAVGIPCLNMVDVTALRVAQRCHGQKVGVLSTKGTRDALLYDSALERHGLEACYPSRQGQEALDALIYDYLKQGTLQGDLTDALFAEACSNVRQQGCELAILACTELSVYRTHARGLPLPSVDALVELARASIETCGATWRD